MQKISVKDARQPAAIGTKAIVQGWIRSRRDSKGGFSFLDVNDGSSLAGLQVIADGSLANYESEVKHLTTGSSVTVEGEIKASGGKGQATELAASKLVVHGLADAEAYPLQKKAHTLEKLREWAHLRPRTNTFGAVTRIRNCVSRSIHNFYQEEGFLYIHTPIITASDCEGAGAMFRVTTLDLANVPHVLATGRSGLLETMARDLIGTPRVVDYSADFFGRPTFLTVSGQLEGEIFACALGKIYTFGPTFRAENSNTSRHLAEFWMVEPEVAFNELTDNMDLAERFLKRIFSDALSQCAEDMAFFAQHYDATIIPTLEKIIAAEFRRLPYTEAIEILEQSGEKFEYPVKWGADLQSEHERYLTEKKFDGPVILFDYPRTIKPFYMRANDDGKTVRAMDVLVPKVGEIIGGSQREERLDVLSQRMTEQALKPDDYWWYLDLRRFGTVPHAGFGLGLERAVQFITGMANIRDVIPFPRTPGSAEF